MGAEGSRQCKRTTETVLKDFPDIGDTGSKREKALTKLLRCIPEKDYLKLKEQFHTKYKLFIESHDNLGKVHQFPPPFTIAVYLSPILEGLEFHRIIAVAAHELAHVFLEHKNFEERDQKEEDKAREQVCEWGFQKEAENHLTLRKGKEIIKITLNPSEQYLFSEKKGDDQDGSL